MGRKDREAEVTPEEHIEFATNDLLKAEVTYRTDFKTHYADLARAHIKLAELKLKIRKGIL